MLVSPYIKSPQNTGVWGEGLWANTASLNKDAMKQLFWDVLGSSTQKWDNKDAELTERFCGLFLSAGS